MKNITILLVLILLSITSFSQTNYYDYSNSQKEYIFFDEFEDNKNDWNLGYRANNSVRYSIEDGSLKVNVYDETGSRSKHKYVAIDQNRDFEIEAKLKYISGKTSRGFALFWGYEKGATKGYKFFISANGKYEITKDIGRTYSDYKSWTYTDYLNKTNWNTLTVRKVDNKVYYFINSKYIYSTIFEDFFGDRIGIQTGGGLAIAVDYLKVSYLNNEVTNYPPEIVITEPNINRGFKVVPAKSVKVSGRAKDSDGIYEVTANGVKASLQSGGYFSVDVPLAVGNNTITVKATDTKMKSSTKTFEVNRKSEDIVSNYTSNEKRVALIFGNANYSGAAHLGVNPINDARDIASTLRTLGFEVIIKTDANLTAMNNAIREFGRQNKDADVALFYFAGHGMQVERVNYLLPVGINIKDKNDVNFECVSVSTVQKIMETSNADRLNLIVLDACRNNPFRSWQRGGETGLADMTPPSGTLIAFATSPGSIASNGSGQNGLYTGELIKQLKKPQRIEDVFINTRVEVERKSGGQQSPWELARLRGKYFLVK
jgi:hypothetical protein